MIRIRFVTGNDFISNAIRAGERDGWATHCEAVMPDGTLLGAHLDGGVMARPTGYDKGTRTRELIVIIDPTLPITLLSSSKAMPLPYSGSITLNMNPGAEIEDKFHAFLRAQLGKPYDMTAIAGLALNRDWREPDSWFCSELQAAALEACGYLPRLSAADNHISPRDLLLVLSGRVSIPNAA